MPLAWSYARTSTARQAKDDRSGMERQEQALSKWLANHPEYQLAEALVDAGVSAGKGRHRTRGALSRFIEGGRNGTVPPGSCLVVESMSRFSREGAIATFTTLLRDVWGQQLAISFCTDGVVLDAELIDREAYRLHEILGGIAQARREWEERSRRSSGAAAKARRLQDEGKTVATGPVPWWIARDDSNKLILDADGGFTVDPQARRIIERAVELAIAGASTYDIADKLTAEGFPAPVVRTKQRKAGAAWSHSQVANLLRRPAIAGVLVRQGAPDLPGYYPPVVSPERWAQLRAVMDRRHKLRGHTRNGGKRIRNLFQTVSRCAICGGPIGYTPPSDRHRPGHPGYASCREGNRRNGDRCHNTGYIEYDQFENHCLTRLSTALWEELLRRPEDDQDRAELEQQVAQLQGEQAALQGRLDAAQEKLADQWEQGASEELQAAAEGRVKMLRAQLATTTDRLAQAQQQLEIARARPTSKEAAAELRQRVVEFWQRLPEATPEQRRDFNRWLLSRQPEIRFLVHSLRPGAPKSSRGIELVVGDESAGIEPLAPLARQLARQRGIADPVLARDRKVGPPELATVGKGRKGQPVIEIHPLAGEDATREQIEDVVAGAAAALELRDPDRQREIRKAMDETDMGNEPDGTMR